MSILSRYIMRYMVSAIFLVALVLMGLLLFISFISELSDIGTGDYRLWQAFIYALLELPQKLYSLLPVAGLLGTLLGLGELAAHYELVAMQAMGVSLKHINSMVLQTIAIIVIIVTLTGEWLAPIAAHTADAYKTLATSAGQALKGTQGIWLRDGYNFIHINTLLPDGHLRGVSRYEFDQQKRLVKASYAEQAVYRKNQWWLHNVQQSVISEQQVQAFYQPEAQWELSFNPKFLRTAAIEPAQMSLIQLYAILRYLSANHLHNNTYSLGFWQRILQPLATIIMMWVGVPFIFGPLRSVTVGMRIVAGTLLGFGFYLLNQFSGPLGLALQAPAWLTVSIPIFVFAAIGYSLNRKRLV
jgi:lipopolysaccharide export system permease protein